MPRRRAISLPEDEYSLTCDPVQYVGKRSMEVCLNREFSIKTVRVTEFTAIRNQTSLGTDEQQM